MTELTKKQQEILDLIKKGMTVRTPTFRYMADNLGITVQSVNDRIDGAIKKGYLTRENGKLVLSKGTRPRNRRNIGSNPMLSTDGTTHDGARI